MQQNNEVKHVFLVGAKSLGAYGGYETFVNKLTEYHMNNPRIRYHVACKANGDGCMDETKLEGVTDVVKDSRGNTVEFTYHNAHCFKIKSPELGSAQAIFYDIKALQYCCKYIKKYNIEHPIIYVLSSRVGPVMGHFAKKIHEMGGIYCNNPDGWKDIIWLNQKTQHKYSVLTA